MSIDIQSGCPALQTEGGNKSDKSETVVAVQMRNEYMVYFGHFQLASAQEKL